MPYRVANKSFVLIHASEPAGQARLLINSLRPVFADGPSHVIVARYRPEEAYYLFTRREVADRLLFADGSARVEEALNLEGAEAVPILEPYASELNAVNQAVVVEDRHVIGFVDRTDPPIDLSKGLTKGIGLDEAFGAPMVERTLTTDFPHTVPLGETCSLLVSLSADLSAGSLPISVPLQSTVDVIVQARRGFELVGPREGSIVVTDEVESMPLQFKFKAVEGGTGVIRIYLFQEGQSLGSLEVESEILAAGAAPSDRPGERPAHSLPSVQVLAPDLSLIITERHGAGNRSLVFELRTKGDAVGPTMRQQFGPVELALEPQQYFHLFFKDLDALPLTDTERYLAANGSDLFAALFPEPLGNLLWSLRERIQSVQIQSEEPWIPWELCRLQGRESGRITAGPFLCEAYQITRWLPQVAAKPALKLEKIALVVPQDSGLKAAAAEQDYVLSLKSHERQVDLIPATRADVVRALSSGEYDGWHFTCHGSLDPERPNLTSLWLEQNDILMPVDLSGETGNLGTVRPLIFLNACQAGQNTLALSGAGGWAERFLKAAWSEEYPDFGAAAFIGAYWSIDDARAHAFAVAFYDDFLDGVTIGEAVQKARLAVRTPDDPTWLAYTVYAHPLARVQ